MNYRLDHHERETVDLRWSKAPIIHASHTRDRAPQIDKILVLRAGVEGDEPSPRSHVEGANDHATKKRLRRHVAA
jgi:hypothetical protein